MNRFELAKLADMHLLYGEARGNSLLPQRFPNRELPNHKIFIKINQNLWETGSFVPIREFARQCPIRDAVEDEVMARIQNEPNTSTRLIASRLDCSKNTVHRVLKIHDLHPFKLQKVQHLLPGDAPRRLEFCEWLLGQADENANFLSIIFTSDEKGFSREGTFNPRNNHEWSEQNPHATYIRGYQQKFGVNVWAGILKSKSQKSKSLLKAILLYNLHK